MYHANRSGWMTRETYELIMIHHILPDIAKKRDENFDSTQWALIILDSHASRASSAVLAAALSYRIHILTIPAHSSHIIQALDRGINGALKTILAAAFTTPATSSIMAFRAEMSVVLADSITKALQGPLIRRSFSTAGIWPVAAASSLLNSLTSASAQDKQAYDHLIAERERRKYLDITAQLLTMPAMIEKCRQRENRDAPPQPAPAPEIPESEPEQTEPEHESDSAESEEGFVS
jgi:hypothetical protein